MDDNKETHLKQACLVQTKNPKSFSQKGRFNPTNGEKKTIGALVPEK